MKELKIALISKHAQPEHEHWLTTDYIDPIEKLGFHFRGTQSLLDEEAQMGCHIIIFTCDPTLNLTEEDNQLLHNICTQDDDSQGHATYTYYFGSLWVMIPICP